MLELRLYGANSYLFGNGKEIYKFKAKDSEIVRNILCLGNVSKVFSADNMKETEFNGYIFDLSVDYEAVCVINLLYVNKYWMIKNEIV